MATEFTRKTAREAIEAVKTRIVTEPHPDLVRGLLDLLLYLEGREGLPTKETAKKTAIEIEALQREIASLRNDFMKYKANSEGRGFAQIRAATR